jgi:hypothetical protein
LFGVGAFEFLNVLLETNDLGPQAVAFVGELSDAFTQPVVVGDHSGSVGGIDETGFAFTLPGAEGTHPFRVRHPLPRSARSCVTSHRLEMVGA